MAGVGIFASFVTAFSLPMFGFVLSQYVFVLALPLDTDDDVEYFQSQRNLWFFVFIGLVTGIGLSAFV